MTGETDDIDNVLAFTKRFDENADIRNQLNITTTPPPEGRFCRHERTQIDEHHRRLSCRLCGKVIDAFDWVNSLAKKETNIDWELRGLRGEIKEHREGLEKLKREEVNCRARIKTAKMQLAKLDMQVASTARDAGLPVPEVDDETPHS